MKRHVTIELEGDDLDRLVNTPTAVEIDVGDADTVHIDTRAVPELGTTGPFEFVDEPVEATDADVRERIEDLERQTRGARGDT